LYSVDVSALRVTEYGWLILFCKILGYSNALY
jgi:hypothetical protein